MQIKLSDHFTYGKILRFTLPSIAMMIFTSIYSVVDGYFVSNYVGKTSFAAVNFIFPFIMILSAVGFMFGSGGSALVAKTLGEGDKERANRLFSLVVYASIVCGAVITVLGILLIRPIAALLGAEGQMLEECVIYGRIILASMIPFMLQVELQSLFITAEKPNLGFLITVVAGVTNIVLDFLLVGVFSFGLVGAALATTLSQTVGGVVSVIYFLCPNKSILRLGKTRFEGAALVKTCTNGFSELLSNISMSLVGMLYNFQLMKYAGENGVAAYGVLMYVSMIFMAIFIGYSIGSAPPVGFHYGAENCDELKNLLKKSLTIIAATSVCMVVLSFVLAEPLSRIFVGYDPSLFSLTRRGFNIYAFSFLFSGFAVFGSCFFTALNNGLVSAIISFMRTMVFQISAVLILPLLLDMDGIWLSVVVSDLLSVVVTAVLLLTQRAKYKY